jgi:hypothetical protein
MRVTRQVELAAKKTGKSKSTLWRWRKAGCDLSSTASIKEFLKGSHHKRSGVPTAEPETSTTVEAESDLPPVGPKGAAAALTRLEQTEERAFARLERAIEHGNPFAIRECQTFYLAVSEVLRRCDLAVEVARRSTDEQVPKFLVEQVSKQISGWLRVAFAAFLTSEAPGLMAIADLGEFKFSAIESFRRILHTTVKTSLRKNPPSPTWASDRVREAWNMN